MTDITVRHVTPARPFAGFRWRETLRAWRQRTIGRRELARLGDHELRDLGLSRAAANFEASKPFWVA